MEWMKLDSIVKRNSNLNKMYMDKLKGTLLEVDYQDIHKNSFL